MNINGCGGRPERVSASTAAFGPGTPLNVSPAEFGARLRKEIAQWTEVAHAAGLKT